MLLVADLGDGGQNTNDLDDITCDFLIYVSQRSHLTRVLQGQLHFNLTSRGHVTDLENFIFKSKPILLDIDGTPSSFSRFLVSEFAHTHISGATTDRRGNPPPDVGNGRWPIPRPPCWFALGRPGASVRTERGSG